MEEIAEEEYIVQYYQVNDVNQLYFAIYHVLFALSRLGKLEYLLACESVMAKIAEEN